MYKQPLRNANSKGLITDGLTDKESDERTVARKLDLCRPYAMHGQTAILVQS